MKFLCCSFFLYTLPKLTKPKIEAQLILIMFDLQCGILILFIVFVTCNTWISLYLYCTCSEPCAFVCCFVLTQPIRNLGYLSIVDGVVKPTYWIIVYSTRLKQRKYPRLFYFLHPCWKTTLQQKHRNAHTISLA